MLDLFRKGGIVQILMGGVVLLLVAAFAMDSRQSSSGDSSHCALEIGGDCVVPRDFNAALRMSVRSGVTEKQIRALGLRQIVMDGLVERQLLLEEANRLGIGVTDTEVDAELRQGRVRISTPAERDGQWPEVTYISVVDPKTERFNFTVYERSIRYSARMSPKDFKIHQRKELLAARMRQFIKSSVRFSAKEAFAQYSYSNQKATVRVAQLPEDWFARFATPLNDTAVDVFAQANTESVDTAWKAAEARYTEGCASLQELVLSYPPAADAADEAKVKALGQSLLKRMSRASSKDFEALARLYSSAPTAAFGGWRGCLDSGQEDNEALLAAVTDLKPGQTSALLEMPNGLRLLRVNARLTKETLATRGRQLVARPLAALAAAKASLTSYANTLLESTLKGDSLQAGIDSGIVVALQPIMAALSPALSKEWQELATNTRNRPRVEISSSFSQIGSYNPVPEAEREVFPKRIAFSLEKADAVYEKALPTRTGLALLQLKEKTVVTQEMFDKEKSEVMDQLKQRAQSAALTRYLARLRSAAGDSIQPNPVYLADADKPANKS